MGKEMVDIVEKQETFVSSAVWPDSVYLGTFCIFVLTNITSA